MSKDFVSRVRSSLCVAVAGGLLGSVAGLAGAQPGEDVDAERRHFNAPPIPMPEGPLYTRAESDDPTLRNVVMYDVLAEEESVVPAAELPEASGLSMPPWSPSVGSLPAIDVSLDGLDELDEGGGLRLGGTPPTPLANALSYPWRSIVKLVMRFGAFTYVCSGFTRDDFHIITAGHCIYNHDPNQDNSTADAQWANEVWVYPGQGDVALPGWGSTHGTDRPWGPSKSVLMRSYTGWTISQNLNFDYGVITLDRRIGSRTGWMGIHDTVAASLNFSGYPSETPYVPAGNALQYFGFDANNVSGSTGFRISLDAFIYGGHSGGPSWVFTGGNRWVEGVHSTSNRMGSATDTRMNTDNVNNTLSWVATDEADRPPLSRPELTEYVHQTGQKSVSKLVVGRGEPISVKYNNLNAGFASTGTITNRFYLSSNAIISDLDTLMDTDADGSLAVNTFRSPTLSMQVPNVAAGTYYAGWIASSAVAEYGGDAVCTNDPCSNVAIISTPIEVENCDADSYEDDENSTQANFLGIGSQSRSLCETGDEDWAVFSLSAPSRVVLETTGVAGDTRMWLYNSGLAQLEFDDDDGAGFFSRIDRYCGIDALPAGTYYVKIDEFGDNDILPSYNLSRSTTACSLIEIFSDGFESGNLSAWSSSTP